MVLATFGLVGGFALVPFRNHIKYPILAAPMVGMLLWSLGILILYTTKLSFYHATLIIGLIGTSITLTCLFNLRLKFNRGELIFLLSLVLITSTIVTLLINFASISLGSDTLLIREGSDQPCYAAIADWLNTHLVDQPPVDDPVRPYQNFSRHMFAGDGRVATFLILSLISKLISKSGFFAFDIGCSVILLAGFFGVSALYCRSRKTLIFCIFALNISFLFMLSRCGYLGKIVAFPSILFLLGLYFIQQQEKCLKDNVFARFFLLLITFPVAMVYPGQVVVFFLIVMGFTFLSLNLTKCIIKSNREDWSNLINSSLMLLIMILSALAAGGLLATLKAELLFADLSLGWTDLFLYQLDIHYFLHDALFTWYTSSVSLFFLITVILIDILVLMLAFVKRNIVSATLSASVLLILIIPVLSKNKFLTYQLAGAVFPISVCAILWLVDEFKKPRNLKNLIFKYLIYSLLLITLGIRIPSYIEALHRYVAITGPYYTTIYSKKELDEIYDKIGNQPVIVEIPNRIYSEPIMFEFGRLGINLQWPSDVWEILVVGRKDASWISPHIKPSKLILGLNQDVLAPLQFQSKQPQDCHVIATTHQYMLYECQQTHDGSRRLTYAKA